MPLRKLFFAAIVFMIVFYAATLLMSYFFSLDFAPVTF